MYYFLKVKEQFISLHLIYIKHFMANNILLNYWINEAHWGYNYLLVIIRGTCKNLCLAKYL